MKRTESEIVNPTMESARVVPGIRPYFEYTEETLRKIGALLDSGQVTNHGPQVREFETRLAAYLGIEDAIAVTNGSDALLIAMRALRLQPGKVILPAYTYIATLNAVVHSGHEPVFCDVEPDSFTIDPACVERLCSEHPDVRCVIPVNVFGVPPDLRAIREICDRAGAKMLYDNAHGFGTELDGHRFQTEPDVQVFSFHATKTLPAIEGGMIATQDPEVFSMAKRLRNHGLAPVTAETIPGFNAKMDEIRATIGLSSLEHFDSTLARRREYGARLMACFSDFPDTFRVQHVPANVATNFQNLGVICRPAEKLGLAHVLDLFKAHGIGVRPYFDPPMYKFRGFEHGAALPVTESVWQTLVSFPIHARMEESVLIQMEHAIAHVAKELRSEC